MKTIGKLPTIGVLAGVQVYYGTILGNFIGPLLHGVYAAARKRGCNLLLASGVDSSYSSAHPAWPLPAADADFVPVGPWNTDGLIVCNPLFSAERSRYVHGLIEAGHPVVFAATGEAGPTVAIDNAGAVRQALEHLLGHGHRRIAFIAGYPDDEHGDSALRLRAFRQLAREYGLAQDERLVAYGHHRIDAGQQAMRHILASGVPFSAVLASNDESAIGAMTALKAAGLRIPEDVAVVGNDDILDATAQVPPLTTVHSSPFQMGFQALELLLDHLEGQRPLTDIAVPTHFVARHSCGCDGEEARPVPAPAMPGGLAAIRTRLARNMTELVLAGTQRLSPDEVRTQARQLARAFIAALRAGDPSAFLPVLDRTLSDIESLEDELYVWDRALAAAEAELNPLREALGRPAGDPLPEEMLARAHATVARHMQHHHQHLVSYQKWIANQAGQLNAQLLAARDESQVYDTLAGFLPQLGIRHMSAGFYQATPDDPLGGCRLRRVPAQGSQAELRFASRAFPPRGLYERPFRLVLLPMTGQDEAPGFVAFDAADMEVCAHVVWQLLTFLKIMRLARAVAHAPEAGRSAPQPGDGGAGAHGPGPGGQARRVVRQAMAYLHTSYMEPISLEDAARYVSVSKEYLARCFRQEAGLTLVTYLNRYRVQQAKALLEEGERSLTEIALECGFSGSAYFSRIFRQETGTSPSQYRRETVLTTDEHR